VKYHYLYISFILLIQGCSITDNNDQGDLRHIDSGILFEIREQYAGNKEDSDPILYLNLQTEKKYSNYNNIIETSLNVERNRIEVRLHGIYFPEIAAPAIGPARSSSELKIAEGIYRLIFRAAAFTDEYRLIVTRNSIQVEIIHSGNTLPLSALYHRYPERSFVYLCGTTPEDTALCRMFIDTAASVLRLQRFEFPESGVIPYPTASQGYYYNMPAQFFYYESEEDFAILGSILLSFKETYIKDKQGIGISVTNWRNKSFYSWGM
jgi:hypothetical protein